jgi:hypothetical protein
MNPRHDAAALRLRDEARRRGAEAARDPERSRTIAALLARIRLRRVRERGRAAS